MYRTLIVAFFAQDVSTGPSPFNSLSTATTRSGPEDLAEEGLVDIWELWDWQLEADPKEAAKYVIDRTTYLDASRRGACVRRAGERRGKKFLKMGKSRRSDG
jgi:hypothetical protein